MPRRDSSRRFVKNEGEGFKIVFALPAFSRIIFWIILLVILSPWIFIIVKFQIWKEIIEKFESLFVIKDGENETPKKNSLFY